MVLNLPNVWRFNAVPHIVVTPTAVKLFLLQYHNCNFANGMNHNVYFWRKRFARVCDPQVEDHCPPALTSLYLFWERWNLTSFFPKHNEVLTSPVLCVFEQLILMSWVHGHNSHLIHRRQHCTALLPMLPSSSYIFCDAPWVLVTVLSTLTSYDSVLTVTQYRT